MLLDTPDPRPLWKKKKKELGIAGAIAAVVVGLIVYVMLTSSTGGPNPVGAAQAIQQQQPEPVAVPTPPIVPMEVAPALQEQYQFYRFVHFLHEMEACPLTRKIRERPRRGGTGAGQPRHRSTEPAGGLRLWGVRGAS